jgi:hypothetical protein
MMLLLSQPASGQIPSDSRGRGHLVLRSESPGQGRGPQEVMIDAGNGKVLSSAYESPKKEAAEKAKDAPSNKSN